MKMKALARFVAAALLGVLLFSQGVAAQTATTTTTLSSAIADSAVTSIVVASATNVDAGGLLYIDREAFDVISVNSTTVRVARGAEGTRPSAHPASALVYVAARLQKTGVYKSSQAFAGTCVRASENFLPQIDVSNGVIWDCPVGSTVWAPVNLPGLNTVRSQAFDIDNGAGTTIDALLIRHPRPITLTACRIVYQGATTGTVAAGNAKVGTTVGGAEVVAATAYADTTAVGATTAMVLVAGKIAAGTPVLVRHTGIAATAAGEAVVECDYFVR